MESAGKLDLVSGERKVKLFGQLLRRTNGNETRNRIEFDFAIEECSGRQKLDEEISWIPNRCVNWSQSRKNNLALVGLEMSSAANSRDPMTAYASAENWKHIFGDCIHQKMSIIAPGAAELYFISHPKFWSIRRSSMYVLHH